MSQVVAPHVEVKEVIDQELRQARIRLQSLKVAQLYETTPVKVDGETVTRTVAPRRRKPGKVRAPFASVRDYTIEPGSKVPRGRKLTEAIAAAELCVTLLEEQLDLWQTQQDAFVAQSKEQIKSLQDALDTEEAAGDAVAERLAAEGRALREKVTGE